MNEYCELTMLLLGQAQTAQGQQEPVAVQSVWDFMTKGGPMMVPLVVFSLVALTVTIERLISLSRQRVIPRDIAQTLSGMSLSDSQGREKARAYCTEHTCVLTRILADVLKLSDEVQPSAVQQRALDAADREVASLRKYLRMLAVIGSTAPLMGLLGTIFGMIEAFQTVALSGDSLGKTELMARGIYEALITTAAGLLVAIPVLMAYHWISAKADQRVMDLEVEVQDFIDRLTSRLHDSVSASPHNAQEQASTPQGLELATT